ncbi:acyl-CoA N-acyltransferase [Aspergillus pseudoustus]|uniref:Acyl-CoA N-acyltransferase n=1 Tax=Aspergillus pseudoustus TaxID=1810923 RepID=A0ABR4J4C9_9EURO
MVSSLNSTAQFTTTLLPPLGPNARLTLPTRTMPFPFNNPMPFNDALAVRLEVFVDEQKCAAEFELDEDDSRSWHWVIYDENASYPGAPSPIRLPVAVTRLVPPPHAPHTHVHSDREDGYGEARDNGSAKYDLQDEPHIKFGRVAVLAAYRGLGLARRLMETSMKWAEENAGEINAALAEIVGKEKAGDSELTTEAGTGTAPVPEWKGLALVHAQVDVEKMYGRLGFVTDGSMGTWVEEGIDHVGMWKRLNV